MLEHSCATCSGICGAALSCCGSGSHSSSKSCQTMDHRLSKAPRGRVPGLRSGTLSGGICLGPGRPRLGQQRAHGFGPAQWATPLRGAAHPKVAATPVVLYPRDPTAFTFQLDSCLDETGDQLPTETANLFCGTSVVRDCVRLSFHGVECSGSGSQGLGLPDCPLH